MNLIDFYVTEVLSEPVLVEQDWGSYWKVLVKFRDDGGTSVKYLTGTEKFVKSIQAGYVGQH